MTHVDEATLVAMRDQEEIAERDRAHVLGCAACSAALARAETRAQAVADHLSGASPRVHVDVAAAKARVRARLDQERERRSRRPSGFGVPLRRAAAILLVTAGAAWALPASPLRNWLTPDRASDAMNPVVEPPAPVLPGAEPGIEVDAVEGLEIAITRVPPGTVVSITRAGAQRLRLSAGEGSRYNVADARVEAVAGAGPIHISIPRMIRSVVVSVNGRMILDGMDGGDGSVDGLERTDEGWTYREPGE